MRENQLRENHYVPEWYQKLFLPENGQKTFYYLDLAPDILVSPQGNAFHRKNILRWGANNCFKERDLYTTFFGSRFSTEIEQKFFGQIDSRKSKDATTYFSVFSHPNWDGDHFNQFITYLSTQKMRTPKGLQYLSQLLQSEERNQLLFFMQRFRNLHSAIWSECIWQIASAEQSDTKFIISDHPVIAYNKAFPTKSSYPNNIIDPDFRMIGTHILFPLSIDKVLILTHTGWVRNPFCDPLTIRINPKVLRQTFFNFQKIQVDRILTKNEVLRINYIIKKTAYRYIASREKCWLFPENHLPKTSWSSLSDDDLLMPDPRSVSFTTSMTLGYSNGRSQSFDIYGRNPQDPGFEDKTQQDRERNTFDLAQALYAEKHGPRRRGRSFYSMKLDNEIDSPELHKMHLDFLKKQRQQTK